MTKPRLIVVSNRVAASQKIAAGGLAVALGEALRAHGGIWFGWSGRTETHPRPLPTQVTRDGLTLATIELTQPDYEDYYKGFSNRSLWPLFHYRIDLASFDRTYWDAYLRVNTRFATTLQPILRGDDLIWVHDYHLMLVGRALRELGATQRIGFFLHIPFPARDVMVALPTHRDLMRALFAFDVIGFQTPADVAAFGDYVVGELAGTIEPDGRMTAMGRTIVAQAFPIGIDADEFAKLAVSHEAARTCQRLQRSLSGGSIIIGVDRLDYSKGLVERLAAYEQLLTAFPSHRGSVSLLQIAPPSRADVSEYMQLRGMLEAAAGRINGRFGEFDWIPIRYLNQAFSRRMLAALYRGSRVGLVTPFRDGMNLVAKEFVAAQDPADPGVLVLSRFAGAAFQLDGALIVNPHDRHEVAEAIDTGLLMRRDERRIRWRAMMEVLRRDDIGHWCSRFLDRLAEDRPAIGDWPHCADRPFDAIS